MIRAAARSLAALSLAAIAAIERGLAAEPADAELWAIKRELYSGLDNAEFRAGRDLGLPPADPIYLDEVAAALAGLGIVLISPLGSGGAANAPVLGIVLALVAGGMWALYILAGGAVGRRVPGTTGVVAGMIVAALVTLPFGVIQAGPALLTPHALLLGLGVAVLSSALPYTLEMRALRAIPARIFGVMMSIEPALAALSGLMFLGERLTAVQWAAMACVIAASAGINLTGRAAHSEPDPVN